MECSTRYAAPGATSSALYLEESDLKIYLSKRLRLRERQRKPRRWRSDTINGHRKHYPRRSDTAQSVADYPDGRPFVFNHRAEPRTTYASRPNSSSRCDDSGNFENHRGDSRS